MDVALEAARIAGDIIRSGWNSQRQISFKGRTDIVTDVDFAAEKAVLQVLSEAYPEFGVLAEESGAVQASSPYTWVVDPLDGTRNYAQGIPHFSTVVALMHEETPVLGVTYDPVREELLDSAQLGCGAFLNGQPIAVSKTSRKFPSPCWAATWATSTNGPGRPSTLYRSLWPGMLTMRLMGSAALGLAYAAAGRLDLYFHHSLAPWDIASGLVLAREAGGAVVDRQGQPAGLDSPSVIAANPGLVDEFLKATEGLAWRN